MTRPDIMVRQATSLLYLAQRQATGSGLARRLSSPITKLVYRTWSRALGIDIPTSTTIGENLVIYHGVGLVVNADTVVGNNVTLRHNTTLGEKVPGQGAPVLGDNVDVGPHVVILGKITIGEGAVIGAGSVVISAVPPRVVVAGNPARIIRDEQGKRL